MGVKFLVVTFLSALGHVLPLPSGLWFRMRSHSWTLLWSCSNNELLFSCLCLTLHHHLALTSSFSVAYPGMILLKFILCWHLSSFLDTQISISFEFLKVLFIISLDILPAIFTLLLNLL